MSVGEPERNPVDRFVMSVDVTVDVKGRGVVVGGTIVSGQRPPVGETVYVHYAGGRPTPAVVAGYDTEAWPPRVGLFLKGVSPDQVPEGSRLVWRSDASGSESGER